MKGRTQLVWSRGLRAALGLAVEKSDQEIVEEKVEKSEVFVRLAAVEWKMIVKMNLRGELLDIASQGDVVRVVIWLMYWDIWDRSRVWGFLEMEK